MSGRHEAPVDIGSAPGVEKGGLGDVLSYLIGLVLSAILTAAAFYFVQSDWLWPPSIPVALSVLAVSQIGVHLVFFLHLTTGRDNVNNILALTFGTLIVTLVIGGTLWINYNMQLRMPMHGHASPEPGTPMAAHETPGQEIKETVKVEARSSISGRVASISCEIGMPVKKGQTCATIDVTDVSPGLAAAKKAMLEMQARVDQDKEAVANLRPTDRSQKAAASRARLSSDQKKLDAIRNSLQDAEGKAQETYIVAPIDGVVISRALQIGQSVGPDTADPLFVFGGQ